MEKQGCIWYSDLIRWGKGWIMLVLWIFSINPIRPCRFDNLSNRSSQPDSTKLIKTNGPADRWSVWIGLNILLSVWAYVYSQARLWMIICLQWSLNYFGLIIWFGPSINSIWAHIGSLLVQLSVYLYIWLVESKYPRACIYFFFQNKLYIYIHTVRTVFLISTLTKFALAKEKK